MGRNGRCRRGRRLHHSVAELESLLALDRLSGRLGELHQIRFVDQARQLRNRQLRRPQLAKRLQQFAAGAFERLESVSLAQVRAQNLRPAKIKLTTTTLARDVSCPDSIKRGDGSNVEWL